MTNNEIPRVMYCQQPEEHLLTIENKKQDYCFYIKFPGDTPEVLQLIKKDKKNTKAKFLIFFLYKIA